ncbi:Rv0340 family IniB-related protein [Mycolicibacterium arenosum]|uniref:Rv0340 family protein n=1 Tax=Mycolicibacterium arenosum TaxID=2952157 RepID=A0ABT1LYZ9_9MYCO|nr:Rv0340 family IniB-related protein [Mycolicibacterium sp. CAU 1645]MCP9272126.1 Rv0340 family protein [Mycolicibacterium sp. CAU 1645]
MANSLLDFVMSLMSDPDAAARYAADPAQALADANLSGVTAADVNHLIPVVAESVSSVAPSAGLDAFGADAASNVWTSGEATAAFDAFGDHLPQQVIDDPYGTLNHVVTTGDPGSVIDTAGLDVPDVPTVAGLDDIPQLDAPVIDDLPFADVTADDGWVQQVHDQLDQHGMAAEIPHGPELDDLI